MSDKAGCCCGLVAGAILMLLLIAALAIGFFCFRNPELREQGMITIEKHWEKMKDGGDELIDNVKDAEKDLPK